jgi:hypothetical protein
MMSARFEIVSLRRNGDDSTWLALILEGEQLGQFCFATLDVSPTDGQVREQIGDLAADFSGAFGVIEQFRALEVRRGARRVVFVGAPPLAAAA